MLRRAFATLVALLTLNVSAAEALRVCANDSTHEHPAKSASAAADHHAHHDVPAPAESHDDCEKPATTKVPATCCDALSSCGTTLIIEGANDEEGIVPDRTATMSADDRAHSAVAGSPEPPPPKG